MDIKEFSKEFVVRVLTEDDVPMVYKLCCKNALYYQHCPPFVTEDGIRDDFLVLPQGKTLDDKYYIGYFDGGRLVAVMDFIRKYPDDHTDFIGFFMVDASVQKSGVGSRIIEDLCGYLFYEGTTAIKLGWVKGNLQPEHFWKKNHFVETGAMSKQENYTIVIAERKLYDPKS